MTHVSELGRQGDPLSPQHPAAVSIRRISKSYPGVQALQDVSLDIAAGEVHALVGENGAGKSTLMKVVAGAVVPDAGTVHVNGHSLEFGDPRRAGDAGVAMIYQELTVVPGLTAAENVFLGDWPARSGWVRRTTMKDAYRAVAERVGSKATSDAMAGKLSVGQQQLIEIMRALASHKSVVIMDEPTASLGNDDRHHLHDVVRRLRADGHTVVYISHDLDEVLDLADRVTVMREGTLVTTAPANTWTKATLVDAMLGRRFVSTAGRRDPRPHSGEPLLGIRELAAGPVLVDHLDLYPGEVVGIGGLVGSGRTEFLRALAGADRADRGHLIVNGQQHRWPRSVPEALRLRIALAPEERKTQGLVLTQSAETNVRLPSLSGFTGKKGRPNPAVIQAVDEVGFNPARLSRSAREFSGGNQQKIVLARWILQEPSVLLLDEPTRGIDIGAKDEVFRSIRQLADKGTCVVFVSSDLEEVAEHADRVLVMSRGALVADFPTAVTVETILNHAFGVTPAQTGESRP